MLLCTMLDVDRLLLYLARKGALSKEIEISTIKMAEETGSTQQTIQTILGILTAIVGIVGLTGK